MRHDMSPTPAKYNIGIPLSLMLDRNREQIVCASIHYMKLDVMLDIQYHQKQLDIQ